MKLATIPLEGGEPGPERRDGRLVVVDDVGGKLALVPREVAPNLRVALEEWAEVAPRLAAIDAQLKDGAWPQSRELAETGFLAPLPRTTSWLDGSAFIRHIVLVRKARGAEPPADLRSGPLMYQGIGDPLLGPREDILAVSEDHGIDFEAEVAVLLDETPMGTTAADALAHVKLLVLMNDVSLRNLIPRELKAGFGFFHGKPPSALAPFAVTPDELGPAWRDGRVHLEMRSERNGELFGHPDAGEMFFPFQRLIEHAAKTRPLPAATLIGSGTVSNEDPSVGSSCLAEKRMLEIIRGGEAKTPFLRFGDRVRIEMLQDGRSVFGAIDQRVVQARRLAPVETAGSE